MKAAIFALAVCALCSGCGTFKEKEDDVPFSQVLEDMLKDPTVAHYQKLVINYRNKTAGDDEFLAVFAMERSLDTADLQLINQSFQKNSSLTFQTLFFLAYEVPTLTKFEAVHETYEAFLKKHSERPKKVNTDNILRYLASDACMKSTEAMFLALEEQWPALLPGQRTRVIKGLADYGISDSTFVAEGFKTHKDFLKAKRLKLSSATKGRANRGEIYTYLTGTQLFHMEPPILPALARLIDNPSESSLEHLRQACAKRAKDEPAPSSGDLAPLQIQRAEEHLEQGDIYMARAGALLIENQCLAPSASVGAESWLGSTLICNYPEILVEALAEEHASASTQKRILEFKDVRQGHLCHDAHERGLQLKLKLLSKVETQNALEDDILQEIFKTYGRPQ
jgi:hypothetical protein